MKEQYSIRTREFSTSDLREHRFDMVSKMDETLDKQWKERHAKHNVENNMRDFCRVLISHMFLRLHDIYHHLPPSLPDFSNIHCQAN